MLKKKPNWIFNLSKRLQSATTIAFSALVSAVVLYSIGYAIYPYTSYKSGLMFAIVIALLIGYPMGRLVTMYNAAIREQNKQIKKSNETKNQLISILGHDIKSPLNNIKKMLDLLVSKDITEAELKQISRQLHNDVDSTLTLTNNLINWIKIQKIDYAPHYEQFKIRDVVDETITLYQPIAENKNIVLEVNYPEDKHMHSDPEMCKIVLRNLVSNSIKFSNPGSKVLVKVTSNDNFHHFEIRDEGVGLEKEEVDNLLNSNNISSHLGTNNEKGNGIGLHLTKQIITQLGGNISLESSPGSGTTFYIKLPISVES